MERIARRFVRLAAFHALDRYLRRVEELSDDELSELGHLIVRLRRSPRWSSTRNWLAPLQRQTLAFAGDKMARLADLRHVTRRDVGVP